MAVEENQEIDRQKVKDWVVRTASVTNPYKRKWWFASVTISGYDFAEKGETIEKAYNALTDGIMNNRIMLNWLATRILKP